MYPPEEKTEIERVLAAFQPYIKTARNEYGQPACDVVWLERLQCYLYTTNYSRSDIMFDIVQKEYHRYNFQNMRLEQIEKELLKQAETEITIAVEPYLEALPEYRETGIEIIKEYTKIYRK